MGLSKVSLFQEPEAPESMVDTFTCAICGQILFSEDSVTVPTERCGWLIYIPHFCCCGKCGWDCMHNHQCNGPLWCSAMAGSYNRDRRKDN